MLRPFERRLTMDKVNEFQLQFRGGDSGVKYLFRGPHTDWGIILMKPGDRLGGHYHNEVEETFYLLEGECKFYVNGVEHRAVKGDVFRLVAPEKHDIWNDSDKPAKFIFIKYPYLPKDKVDC
jgi:quercetin dioxygenase-like cupin family protein